MYSTRSLQTIARLALLLLTCLLCNHLKSGAQETMLIELNKLPAKQIDIAAYLEEIFIVPLETKPDNLMGQYNGFEQDDSDIFYLSRENQTIYHFSSSGKYLNSISRLGKGPGEYASVRNMRIVPGTQTILLSDPRQNKMIQLTYAGNLVKEFTLPQSTARFVVLNKNTIALHGGKMVGLDGNEPMGSDLIFLDLNGKIIGRKFPFTTPLSFEFSNAFTRPNEDGSYYYSKQFDFNLYQVKDTNQPQVYLKFDYGKGMVTLDGLNGTGMDALGVLRKEGKTFSLDQLYNTYRQLGLLNFRDRKASLLLINKKTLNLKSFGTDSLSSPGNFHGFRVRLPQDTYKDYFLYTLEAVDLYDLIHKLSPEQIKTLKKQIKGFDRILDIKREDNPVLVYYRFRDF